MLVYIGIGLSALSLLLNIVGLAIPNWVVAGGYKTGLWKMCYSGICASVPTDSTIQATRAMEILGVLAISAALVCAILKQFVMKDQKILPKVSGGSAIAAAIFMIIGAVIFAVKYNTNLQAGFALCIVAGVLAIVAAILILLGFKET
ncbi:hypothetical protein ACF0H5_013733 [Mactra antiquata]